jgi:hypothetical protein
VPSRRGIIGPAIRRRESPSPSAGGRP